MASPGAKPSHRPRLKAGVTGEWMRRLHYCDSIARRAAMQGAALIQRVALALLAEAGEAEFLGLVEVRRGERGLLLVPVGGAAVGVGAGEEGVQVNRHRELEDGLRVARRSEEPRLNSSH